jgi:adenylate cyclase
VLPLQTLRDAGAQHGDAGVEPDDDFVVRRMPPARAALRPLAQHLGVRPAPAPSADADRLVAYRGPRGSFDTLVLPALEPGLLPAGYFRGKVVLVGRSALTASELQHSQADLFNAPFAALGGERLFPGVELQATLLDNHVTGAALRPVPEGWSLTLVLLALAVLVPASVRWHPGTVAGVAAGLSGAVLLLSWWLFAQARLWLPPLLPLAAVVAIYGATALVAYATARLRRAPGARHVCTVCAPEVSSA